MTPILDQAESVLRDATKRLPKMGLHDVRSLRIKLEELAASVSSANLQNRAPLRLTRLRRDAQLSAALLEQACHFLQGSSSAVARLSSGYGPTGTIHEARGRAAVSIEV
jgi:hypothetical protein